MTVLLTSGTVGKVRELWPQERAAGDVVTVDLHDENGMPISEDGEIAEVLEW